MSIARCCIAIAGVMMVAAGADFFQGAPFGPLLVFGFGSMLVGAAVTCALNNIGGAP